MGNSFFKNIFLYFFCLVPMSGVYALPGERFNEFWDTIAEEVFLSPQKKEETEIKKRILEANSNEIRKLRIQIKNKLQKPGILEGLKKKEANAQREWKEELETYPNLGGFFWKSEDQMIYQWGDWTDYYEDGLSRKKIRLEGQLPSFHIDGETFYFFVKNESGYSPVEFQFVGWESLFYMFGDDGYLRYTNDPRIDRSLRIPEFRRAFEEIRTQISDTEIIEENDLKIFIVPGKNRPIYYALFGLRIFLYLWTAYLVWVLVRTAFPHLKNQLPKDLPKAS